MALFESAWGSVRLWLANLSVDAGRTLIRQPYSSGNLPDSRDRGEESGPIRCTLLFDEMIGESRDAKSRLEDFLLLKGKGAPQLFVHPFFGALLASLGEFSYAIDANGTLTGEATFYPEEETGAVTVDPVGVALDVAVDDVEQRAADATAQLEAVDLESDLPSLATATSTGTFDADVPNPRDVLVQVATVSDRLWDEIDALNMAADVELWPVMKAYVMLGEAVRAGGDRALGDPGAFMTVRVDAPTSLRRLLADIYGAADGNDRYDEAVSLNDIRTPGSIPPGTTLRLLQPTARV